MFFLCKKYFLVGKEEGKIRNRARKMKFPIERTKAVVLGPPFGIFDHAVPPPDPQLGHVKLRFSLPTYHLLSQSSTKSNYQSSWKFVKRHYYYHSKNQINSESNLLSLKRIPSYKRE